jgi:predicted Zn finger-like uncharacterized protein
MNITCPKCNFSKTVDPAKVPDRPVKVNCPKCNQGFTFDKSELKANTAEAITGTVPPEQVTCPTCGLVQNKNDQCSGCGVVYSKLQARQEEHDTLNGNPAKLRRKAELSTPQQQPKAGFWIRAVALILDVFVVLAIQAILGFLLTLILGLVGVAVEGDPSLDTVSWLLAVTIRFGYAVFFIGYCGQTPGKMALRIKVIRTDGNQISYGRAALREVFGKVVSAILLGIGYLMVAFDSKKQGLHDKIADTYVIKL